MNTYLKRLAKPYITAKRICWDALEPFKESQENYNFGFAAALKDFFKIYVMFSPHIPNIVNISDCEQSVKNLY